MFQPVMLMPKATCMPTAIAKYSANKLGGASLVMKKMATSSTTN